MILLALLLLAWLVLTLVFRYSNPPWGYLELVDPNGHVVWTGPFDSGDREHAVRSRYIWKLNPPIFGIVKIKAHSWDRPKRYLLIPSSRYNAHKSSIPLEEEIYVRNSNP